MTRSSTSAQHRLAVGDPPPGERHGKIRASSEETWRTTAESGFTRAIKLRIDSTGAIRGLWTDAVDWRSLGHLAVERASHVEFCNRRQIWTVRVAKPRGRIRRALQWLTSRPRGEILHCAKSREDALAWERGYFDVPHSCRRRRPQGTMPGHTNS